MSNDPARLVAILKRAGLFSALKYIALAGLAVGGVAMCDRFVCQAGGGSSRYVSPVAPSAAPTPGRTATVPSVCIGMPTTDALLEVVAAARARNKGLTERKILAGNGALLEAGTRLTIHTEIEKISAVTVETGPHAGRHLLIMAGCLK